MVLGATVKINTGGGTGHWQDVDAVLGQLAVVDSAILLQRESLERYAALIYIPEIGLFYLLTLHYP